jgi:hypothetical protein
MPTFEKQRTAMVVRQIVARGVEDPAVLAAMRTVPCEAFVPEFSHEFTYEDAPLPIQAGQTISQPYIVALMIVPHPRKRAAPCNSRPVISQRLVCHARARCRRRLAGAVCLTARDGWTRAPDGERFVTRPYPHFICASDAIAMPS